MISTKICIIFFFFCFALRLRLKSLELRLYACIWWRLAYVSPFSSLFIISFWCNNIIKCHRNTFKTVVLKNCILNGDHMAIKCRSESLEAIAIHWRFNSWLAAAEELHRRVSHQLWTPIEKCWLSLNQIRLSVAPSLSLSWVPSPDWHSNGLNLISERRLTLQILKLLFLRSDF